MIPHTVTDEAVEAVDIGRRELAGSSSAVVEACRHLAEEGTCSAAAFHVVMVVGCVPSAIAEDDRVPYRLAEDVAGTGWQADCHWRPLGSAGQRSRGRTFCVRLWESLP